MSSNGTTRNIRPVIEVPISAFEVYAGGSVLETYVIDFESNEGTSVDSMVSIQGMSLGSLPSDPTKAGYKFDGWFEDDNTFLNRVTVNTVPQGNTTYYAKWVEKDDFSIVYSHVGSCVFNNGVVTGTNCNPVADGNSKQYIDTGIALYTNDNIDKDYEIGFTVKEYGTQVNENATIMNTKNEAAGFPGLVFRRNKNENKLLLQSRKSSSANEEKKYEISDILNKKIVISRIDGDIYISIDGATNEFVNSQYRSVFSRTVWFGANPTAETGTTAQRFFIGEIADMYIRFGDYSDNPVRKVIFDVNDDVSPTSAIFVNNGFKIGTLPTPTYEGHTFIGWYDAPTGGNLITENERINSDKVYYAHWVSDNNYLIELDANGGIVSPDYVEIAKNTAVGNSLPTPTRTGYTFDYWYSEGDVEITSATVVTKDDTYYAHWTINNYTVTFDDGYGNVIMTLTRDYNEFLGSPLPTASKPYHTFIGWFTEASGGTQVTEQTRVTGADTYYAHWEISSHTVTFNAHEGTSSVNSLSVTHGSSIGTANMPTATYTGHYFDGWWTEAVGGTRVTGTEEILTDGIIYHAHYKDYFTITFDADGGVLSIAPDTTMLVPDGTSIGIGNLPTATKAGYTFNGWFTQTGSGGTQYLGTEIITQNDTYHAQWTEIVIPMTTVNFMDDDGVTVFESVTVEEGTSVGAYMPNNPTRSDYIFAGWYINGNILIPFNSQTTVSGDEVNVVALWKEKISIATITTDNTPFTVVVGDTKQISVTATGGGLVEDYTLSSSDTTVATVLNSTVTGVSLGTSTITITGSESGTTRTLQVTVINTRKVTYKDGDTVVASYDIVDGNSIDNNVPTSPTKAGYVFDRWYYYDGVDVTSTPLDTTKVITQSEIYQAGWALSTDYVAIGTQYFETIQEAIDSLTTNAQTELRILQDISDVSGRTTVPGGRDVVINAYGHTVSCGTSATSNLLYNNNGKLTVKNGEFTCGKSGLATLENTNGTLYIEDGAIVSNTGDRSAIYNMGLLYISGGTISTESSVTIRSTVQNNGNKASINMSGGIIIQKATTTSDKGPGAIKVVSGSSAVITGGTIISYSTVSGAIHNEGNLTIGTKNSEYNTLTPIIQGEQYGINSTTSYSLFDGIIKGKTNNQAVNDFTLIDEVSGIEDNSTIGTGTDGDYYTLFYTIS